jgi:hypothetical protein
MSNDALDDLAELRAVGLALTREGESLRVRPSSKLTEARTQAISDHKRELLAALEAEQTARQIIERAARRRVSLPSPPAQAATPGQPTNRKVPTVPGLSGQGGKMR